MEKDIGKIKKNDNTDIVVRIDDFGGRTGLTIREFSNSETYQGFTKSGTRIPAESVEEFKTMINSIKPEDLKAPEGEQQDLAQNQDNKQEAPEATSEEPKDSELL
jgi:hypothetical protein